MGQGYKPQPSDGYDKLAGQIRDLQRQVDALRTAAGIQNTAISGGEFKSADFDGDLATNNAGTTGWALADGAAAFGSLILRDNIIGNDALTNPVIPDYLFAFNSGFSLTTSPVNKATINRTVPAGVTQLAAVVIGRVYAINPTGSLDYLYAQQAIAGFGGNALPLGVSASGGSGTNVSPFSTLVTGLTPGSTVTFALAAYTNTASWAFNANNLAEMGGVLLWFR